MTKAGWVVMAFRSGDVGQFHGQGCLHQLGRAGEHHHKGNRYKAGDKRDRARPGSGRFERWLWHANAVLRPKLDALGVE